jgi:hypothetical protein
MSDSLDPNDDDDTSDYEDSVDDMLSESLPDEDEG